MLFTYQDIENERNIDLTEIGETIGDSIIAAVTSWAETIVGYPLEAVERNAYFDEGDTRLYLPTIAPVTEVDLATFNTVTTSYEAVSASDFRFSEDGIVNVNIGLPSGFQAVRATFTAGWTAETLPRDLRNALIDLAFLKLQQINNLAATDPTTSSGTDEETPTTGALKKIQSLSYTEEYDTSQSQAYWKAQAAQLSKTIGDDVPAGIREVVNSYRRAWSV